MGVVFNADEIFEVAKQIERNGAAFYRKAAAGSEDEQHKKLLLGLAEMEVNHEQTFAELQAELGTSGATYDPEDDAVRYLQAFAGGQVFSTSSDPCDFLETQRDIVAVLKKAIALEKDSVTFYVGIRNMVPADLGNEKVDQIIREEMGHITLLTRQLDNV